MNLSMIKIGQKEKQVDTEKQATEKKLGQQFPGLCLARISNLLMDLDSLQILFSTRHFTL